MPSFSLTPSNIIDRLPNELLADIFLQAAYYPATDEKILLNYNSVVMPTTFSAVNKRWRALAHSTSALWTNILATIGTLREGPNDTTVFDTQAVTSHLKYSRQQPLSILIDARDSDWDFSEPEIPSAFESTTYVRPFTPEHMRQVLAFISPYVSRWKHVSILTDSWAPLHAAIVMLNKCLLSNGAPLLESLSLIRCNEYVSHSPQFQPGTLKVPAFLDSLPYQSPDVAAFPKLRHLNFGGAIVNWDRLITELGKNHTSLRSLTISHMSPDVCLTVDHLREILENAPELKELVIDGSGPIPTPAFFYNNQAVEQVYVPNLESLEMGFRSILDGLLVLETINAPNLKSLTLGDSNHPADSYDTNADRLLAYLASGERQSRAQNFSVAYSGMSGSMVRMAKESRKTTSVSSSCTRNDEDRLTHAPYPSIEDLSLKRLYTQEDHLRMLYHALPDLKTIELHSLPVYAVEALTPADITSFDTSISPSTEESPSMPTSDELPASFTCPCPNLQKLSVFNIDSTEAGSIYPAMDVVCKERGSLGANPIKEVHLHVDLTSIASILTPNCRNLKMEHGSGTLIKIFDRSPYVDSEDEEEDEEEDEDASGADQSEDTYNPEADAYEYGGAFNDPVFDTYYSIVEGSDPDSDFNIIQTSTN